MHAMLSGWRFDPVLLALWSIAGTAYVVAAGRYRRVRGRPWPRGRQWWFAAGLASLAIAVESPLDAAGDMRFAPHMVQHLILTDVTAPCLLLGAPLLLALSVSSPAVARRFVHVLKGPVVRIVAFPAFTWTSFILALWLLHFTGFFEAALDVEAVHVLEHAIYLGTALLFWLPVISIGPTPWSYGPLQFPIRMVYLLAAMPAEGMLGFTINGARHVLYPHYAAAGLGDQQTAGEIMWIGGTFAMFVAFMGVGYQWSQHEQRLAADAD